MGLKPRLFALARRLSFDGRKFALALLIVILIYQVLVPFMMIIWTSFKTARPGEPEFLVLHFTLANYIRAYASKDFWSATWNTLYFGLAATTLALLPGTFLAWVVARTNTPLARLIGILTLGRIIIPGILITVSWILIASPNIGILNYLIEALFGAKQFLNIYSFWGMVWVHCLEMAPLAYLLLSAAFQGMDPRLEEASNVAGAGRWSTFIRVSLPLILPATSPCLSFLGREQALST